MSCACFEKLSENILMLGYHFPLFDRSNILGIIETLHKVTLLKIGVLIINGLCDFKKKECSD